MGIHRFISEAGAKSLYASRTKFGSRYLYALAYRSGRGAVATMLASDPKLHLWIYRAKKTGSYTVSEIGHEMIQSSIDACTEILTEAQGGCEWHIIRAGTGLITSTVAFTIAQLLQANTLNSESSLNSDELLVLNLVGISTTEFQSSNQLPDRETLGRMKVAELKTLCRNRGLQMNGNKQDLIDRLENSPIAPVNIFSVLLSKWFMKPIKSSYFKTGSQNESNILRCLGAFLLSDGPQGYSLEGSPVCRGLLRRKVVDSAEPSFLATSIDGVAVLSRSMGELTTTCVCVLELKTMCTRETERQALARLECARGVVHDTQRNVFTGTLHSDVFKILVWTPQYKTQVLHHAAVSSVPTVMFVVASTTTIIYSIVVQINPIHTHAYVTMMERVCQQNITVLQNSRHRQGESPQEFGHAVDSHTVHLWQKLSAAIIEVHRASAEQNNSIRMPPAHDLLPYAISLWNHVKGGQDVCSRILKNVKVDFRGLSPRAFILIRFVLTALMNAHMLKRLLRVETELERFSSYVELKQHLNRQSSFWEFLRDLVVGGNQWIASDKITRSQPLSGQSEQGAVPVRESNGEQSHAKKRNILQWLNGSGREIRLSTTTNHIPGTRQSRRCPLCHARTTCYCQACDVAFCRTSWGANRKSCFEKAHTQANLRFQARPVESGGQLGRKGRKRNSMESRMQELPQNNRRRGRHQP